jgi:HTH-type transcriptional regulator/antitoxin HigA
MHELAHICNDYQLLADPILDDLDDDHASLVEKRADRLANASLISRNVWRSSKVHYQQSKESILEFAAEQGIHPAIVAGRLRRELNRHDLFADIVNAVDVRKVLLPDG